MARVTCLESVRMPIVTPALCRILEALCLDPDTHVVTSIGDGTHNPISAHYRGEALDVRTSSYPDEAARNVFMTRLGDALGPSFFVLLEQPGATPATTAEHVHVQLKHGATWPPAVFQIAPHA